jgi:hypothetical protein
MRTNVVPSTADLDFNTNLSNVFCLDAARRIRELEARPELSADNLQRYVSGILTAARYPDTMYFHRVRRRQERSARRRGEAWEPLAKVASDEKFPEDIQFTLRILERVSCGNIEAEIKSSMKILKDIIRKLEIDGKTEIAIIEKWLDIAGKLTGYKIYTREDYTRLWYEREEFPAPCASGELTPVMETLDKALLINQAVPPMRSLSGHPVEVDLREPAGLHELTAEGSNDSEPKQSRLPPPKSYILARHTPNTLALTIERHARFFEDIDNKHGGTFRIYKRLQKAFVLAFLEFKKSKLPRVSSLMTMPLVLPNGKLLASHGLNRERLLWGARFRSVRGVRPSVRISA